MTNDALKPLRDKIAKIHGEAWKFSGDNPADDDHEEEQAIQWCLTEIESILPQIEQAIRAEVQAAIQDLFCEKHKDTGIAASEGYLWDECPTCEIQIAEANALRKAADQLDAIYPERTRGAADGLLKKCIETVLSLIPPASQTLLDARDAAVRLKEDELLWSLDFNDAYNSGYLTTRGRELLTKRMDELRAASQPTQGGNNERSRG
jgi:hypothetical protein